MALGAHPVAEPGPGGAVGDPGQGGGRDVDGEDRPPLLGQPQRAAATPAAQVECLPGGHCLGHLDQHRVRPAGAGR